MNPIRSALPRSRGFFRDEPADRRWRSRIPWLLGMLLMCLATQAFADAFIVNTNTDADQDPAITDKCAALGDNAVCTLRAAIMIANTRSGAHTIDITVPSIQLVNGDLPTIMAPVIIHGNHATIDGNSLGCFQLTDSGDAMLSHADGATGSQLYDLVIGKCNGSGISANGHNYVFSGNFIGVDATGLVAMPNSGHGIAVSASHVYPDTSTNFLLNLYNTFPALPVDASEISAFSSNLATALASLQPVLISGNVISGNAQNGIEIFSENIAAVTVTANMIGTDSSGNVAIPNGGDGVHLSGSSFANLIGPGNVISGNGANGVHIDAGTVFLPNFIMGNRIGLSATTPGVHVGNALSGIVTDTSPDTSATNFNPSLTSLVIGPANDIADNQGANNNAFPDVLGSDNGGIVITGASNRVRVVANTIGMAEFPPGVPISAPDYGNAGDGIIVTAGGNTIGPANVIAANARHGVVVSGSGNASTRIVGNSIGVDPVFAGDMTLGNGADGVHIDAASATIVGGPNGSDANTIAANQRNGIKLRNGGGDVNGWGNLFQRNAVFGNAVAMTGIDIDLEHPENAPDGTHSEFSDNYANRDQAPAEICVGNEASGACSGSAAPSSGGGTTTLQWTLASHGPADFRIEFFTVDAATTTASTSIAFLGEELVSTDASGKPADSAACNAGRCTATLTGATGGRWIVATTTDITPLTDTPPGGGGWQAALTCFAGEDGTLLTNCSVNDTSEYSNVVAVPAAAPSVTTDPASAITDTAATLNGTVSANGAATTAAFEYGPTTSYGSSVAAAENPLAADAVNAGITAAISGLTCGTTLHYRANAANGIGGTINGNDRTLVTAACAAAAPTATTGAATGVTATSATLNGVVSANGATTTVTFEYGLTNAYGGAGSPLTAIESPLSSGSTNAPVSVALGGLACGTTYHFRVDADNGIGGTIAGTDQTFATAPCAAMAPTVTTTAATQITATSAVLNGVATANGATTTVTFDYGTTPAYGGLGSPLTAAESPLSSGASNAPISVALSGLVCNTTYHFRANANNGIGGTINGADLNFTTAACPLSPTAVTNAASAVTATTATLNGIVSSNGSATNVTFEYGTTTAYGGAGSPLAAAESPLAANAVNAPVSVALSGLACNTTYHARVDADNGNGGPADGNDVTFTTAACPGGAPTAVTNAASAITATGATLGGTVSSNGAPTNVTFEYGLTSAYGGAGSPLAAVESPLAANATNAPVSAPLSGLSCNTVYHFRVDADNGVGGMVSGADQTFTTGACAAGSPTAATNAATAIGASGATLNGSVSSNGTPTVVKFEFGTSSAYGAAGSPVTATQSPLAANAVNAPVSATLANLACNTTYHFRVDADNGIGGTIAGGDLTFTTSACPAGAPTATTTAASSITAASATLNGLVSANGSATTVTFEYGPTTAYGGAGSPLTAVQSPLGAAASNAAVSADLAGLACATLYHYRVVAANGGATVDGADRTFTTAACSTSTTFSGPTVTGTGTVTAQIAGGGPACGFATAALVGPPATPPQGVSFPDGLFDFTTSGCTGPVTLTVTFPTAFQSNESYWKYGPTPGQPAAHWYTIGAAQSLSLSGHVASFVLNDGAVGDDDGLADGSIRDPGGPAVAVGGGGNGGGGGGNGEAMPVPALSDALRALLAGLLLAAGAYAARGRIFNARTPR